MRRYLLYIGTIIFIFSCASYDFQPATGDLLFQVNSHSPMTDAITASTEREGPLNFSHVAIAVRSEGADSVLEATGKYGVRMVSLAEFLAGSARIKDAPGVVVMRLRDTTGRAAAAVGKARHYLGLPYDYSYLPDNGKFYCSELVWESYRDVDSSTRLFTARPMNFRATDGTLPAFWQDLFAEQGLPVPEGVPGTNPNDMSEETCLEEVYRYF